MLLVNAVLIISPLPGRPSSDGSATTTTSTDRSIDQSNSFDLVWNAVWYGNPLPPPYLFLFRLIAIRFLFSPQQVVVDDLAQISCKRARDAYLNPSSAPREIEIRELLLTKPRNIFPYPSNFYTVAPMMREGIARTWIAYSAMPRTLGHFQ